MSERFAYHRNADIGQIGLTRADMDNRGLILEGVHEEELLPPYLDDRRRIRAGRILDYARQFDTVARYADWSPISVTNWRELFPDKKIIEVVGGLAEICVPLSIEGVTQEGFYAYINSRRLIGWKSSYSDFTLGKIVMRDVSKYAPDTRCLILGREKYIYYKA